MALDLDRAPFAPQFSIDINQKRASDHTHKLAAVQSFFVYYIEQAAHCLIRIGYQVERKVLFRPEFFVGRNTVS